MQRSWRARKAEAEVSGCGHSTWGSLKVETLMVGTPEIHVNLKGQEGHLEPKTGFFDDCCFKQSKCLQARNPVCSLGQAV